MQKFLLPNKRQYKVNLHSHSLVSDGHLSALELKQKYMAMGYSAVAFTDHDVLVRHNELCDKDFIAVNGYEYKLNDKPDEDGKILKSVHINLLAKTQDVDTQVCFSDEFIGDKAKELIPFIKSDGPYKTSYTPKCVNEVVQRAKDAGYLAIYNHPCWCNNTDEFVNSLLGFCAVEAINNSQTVRGREEDSDRALELFARRGMLLGVIGADDNHNKEFRPDSFGAYNMVCLDELTYPALIKAIEEGDMYATSGPIIKELYFDGTFVTVKTENTVNVKFFDYDGLLCEKDVCDGGEAKVLAGDINGYVRIKLTSNDNKHAYTKAYCKKKIYGT